MTAVDEPRTGSAPQSAAAPSPFPPIAEYAFLSDCHTSALIAPDGGIGWLCVPRFDSPSVFGTLLDRQAGFFRIGPFGVNLPTARQYEPGTNTLVTTWQTPGGWIVVRDALTMGPRRSRGHDHAAHAPADRRRRRAPARAHRRVHRGRRRGRARLRARLRLRPRARRVGDRGRGPARRRRHRRGPDHPPADRHGARHRGRPRAGPPRHARGRPALLLPVVGGGPGFAGRWRRRPGTARRDDALLARMAEPGAPDRPPLAPGDPALRAGHQGPHLHAHRRHGRGGDDVAARDAGRRAQLGLPLHVDARLDVHPAGAALARPRLGGRRVHAVRRRPFGQRRRLAPDHVRDRRASRPDRDDARRPVRLRRRAPGARGQRRVRPAPERRLRRGARLDPAAHAAQRAAAAAAVADRASAGRLRDQGLARARPGHLGGPRRAAALRLLEAHVLGRDGSRGEARRDPRRP